MKTSNTEGVICFLAFINEQTVCEADREHRRCGFASESGGEGRANGLRSRQRAPKVRVCE